MLFICDSCEEVHGEGERGESDELHGQFGERGSLEIDRSHDGYEPPRREDDGEPLRPCGHRSERREESAHEHELHHEEEKDKDTLLHRVGYVRQRDGKAGHGEGKNKRREVDDSRVAFGPEAIDDADREDRFGEYHHADEPIRNEFAESELDMRNRRDVDLLDGAFLLLADEVKRRNEAANHQDKDDDEGGNHIEPIIECLVVEIADGSQTADAVRPLRC